MSKTGKKIAERKAQLAEIVLDLDRVLAITKRAKFKRLAKRVVEAREKAEKELHRLQV